MKILYVILSCEQYRHTRQVWQRETWLNGINDVLYLSQPVGEETYQNAPYKYVQFLRDWGAIDMDAYDWLFFCDDDTFVYTQKLNIQLNFVPNAPMMIGFKGGEFPIHNLNIAWCSGGAGIALSREAVKNIQTHLRSTPRPLVTHETDISLAIWATMANAELRVIHNKRFSPFNKRDAEEQGMKDCITYHYCTKENFYDLYNQGQTV